MGEPEGTVAVRTGSTSRAWQVMVLVVAMIASLTLGMLMGRSIDTKAPGRGASRAAASAPVSLRMDSRNSTAFRVMRHMNQLTRDKSAGP
jgi:hypothetical protein